MRFLLSVFWLSLILLVPLQAIAVELMTAAQDSNPKFFLNKDGIMSGLCVDIIKEIENADPEIKFQGYEEFLPFKRMLKKLENGEIDVFFGFVKNREREANFVFIQPPLYSVQHVVAVLVDDDIVLNSFEDIRSLGENGAILTIYGTSTGDFLQKQGGLIIDSGAKTIPDNLEKLLLKRGRFVYYHKLGLVSTISSEGLENKIKILPTIFRQYYQYTAFSKHVPPDVVDKVKSVLKKLKMNGKLDQIFNRYSLIKQ